MAFNVSALRLPLIRRGSNNPFVLAWQRFLRDQKFPVGIPDGDFGPNTDRATRAYQEKNNLGADGVVGNNTYGVALKQGLLFLLPNLNGKNLLSYLRFGETEIKDIQRSLNQVAQLPPPLTVDGDFGPRSSKGLAEAYKKRDVRLREELENALSSATKNKLGSDFAPALDIFNDYAKKLRFRLSGEHWYKRFPTSDSISSLTPSFRWRVQAFEKALLDAGCKIIVTATLRPRQRAYLMHYAARIDRRQIAPWRVPRLGGVDIDWVHYTNAGSLRAAQDMVDAYELGGNPVSLRSNHILGRAVDWIITWEGTIQVKDARGRMITIGGPEVGAFNRQLWNVGRSYGVRKLATDPPHWSSNGY
ncbi:MAG: peptidoglycan-binding domain-containing protein [Calothrix sp. MO_192.B10]|nr:peptidoglycan-binding domain-containing protein [Calothrix sp. MO_192.B10]